MKVVFMGTPDFAVPTLNAIVEAGHEVLCVVAQPDKPKGRGKKLVSPPTIERARVGFTDQTAPCRTAWSFCGMDETMQADVAVVIAYGRILVSDILGGSETRLHQCPCIPLTKVPWSRTDSLGYYRGESKTGVCTMQMDEGMDTGDVLLSRETNIPESETTAELWNRLANMGADLLVETLDTLDSISPTPQDHSNATYAPLIQKSLGHIDWNKSAIRPAQLDSRMRVLASCSMWFLATKH